MNSNLDSISISRAKNGFSVKHNFKARPTYTRGNAGGFSTQYNAPEEHVFAQDEGHKLIAHVAKTLGLKEAKEEQGEVPQSKSAQRNASRFEAQD